MKDHEPGMIVQGSGVRTIGEQPALLKDSISSLKPTGQQIESGDQKLQLSYLDMLVDITVNFIRAEHPSSDHFVNRIHQDNQLAEALTVNASACEFLELILKQVEKYFNHSHRIAHIIIEPLINTFHHVIERKNYAMQVNIINLLDLILNECNFQGSKGDTSNNAFKDEDAKQRCAAILRSEKLLEAIKMGLESDVSFVRQKFIKFVEMLVPYMRRMTKEYDQFKDSFKKYIDTLIDVFCWLLSKVDISFFSHSVGTQNVSNLKTDYNDSADKNPGTQSRKSNVRQSMTDQEGNPFDTLRINQEADIVLIIGGLQVIINTCLDIKSDGIAFEEETVNEEVDEEEQIRIRDKKNETKSKSGFLGGIFGGGETSYFAPDIFNDIRKQIYEKLPQVFVSCIYCWNHVPLFNWNDYHFTRHGMFAYNHEDTRRVIDKLRVKDRDGVNQMVSLEQNVMQNCNDIQKKVILLLRPIAKKVPDQFIEGAVQVWIKKTSLGEQLPINRSYEKII